MERTQIYFTKHEKKFFKEDAKKIGISMAELIRRVLDEYIKRHSGQKNES
jgi:hypothetical protein